MNTTLEIPITHTAALAPIAPDPEVDVDELDTAMPLTVVFQPFQTTLEKWQSKVKSLVVSDLSQTTEMAQARLARLELKDARVNMDKTRKGLVENLKARTGKIDATARIIRDKIEALEATLLESEQFAERHAAKLKSKLKLDRETELLQWVDTPIYCDVSDMSEKDYAATLANAKLLRETKLAAAAKAEADRLTKAEADRLERERMVAENDRLKAEAIEKERLAEKERKRIKEARAEEVRKDFEEKQRVEAEHAKRLEAERVERLKIAADRDEKLRKAKEESDRISEANRLAHIKALADAKAESDRLAAIAIKEKKRLEAIVKADMEENERLKAKLDEQARLTAAEQTRRDAAIRAIATAPDQAKIEAYALALEKIALPDLPNPTVVVAIKSFVGDAVQRIRAMIPRL